MMGAMKNACLARSGFACIYLAFVFVSAVTLFVLSSGRAYIKDFLFSFGYCTKSEILLHTPYLYF